jgi:hypothetical protein
MPGPSRSLAVGDHGTGDTPNQPSRKQLHHGLTICALRKPLFTVVSSPIFVKLGALCEENGHF